MEAGFGAKACAKGPQTSSSSGNKGKGNTDSGNMLNEGPQTSSSSGNKGKGNTDSPPESPQRQKRRPKDFSYLARSFLAWQSGHNSLLHGL
jgi:hypothetical protein